MMIDLEGEKQTHFFIFPWVQLGMILDYYSFSIIKFIKE
jgi:hypothetical protein